MNDLSVLLLLAGALSAAAPVLAADDDVRCHRGAYRLNDGTIVDISPVSDAGKLRWRLVDGRSGLLTRNDNGGGWRSTLGWSERADGVTVAFGETCAAGTIRFDGQDGHKLQFDITDTTFAGNGVTLRGRLVLPRGEGKVPVAVQVHGSEDYSAVDLSYAQNLFPAHGVGVFVYDKRGTGESTGTYTQDFHLLSDDARAALLTAKKLAGERVAKIGFQGGSQAGWIAPLAASKTPPAQFVLVGYGLADTPLSEDRDQVMLDLRNAGYGDEVLAKAREVTDAAGVVVASRGARGWDEFAAVKAKYGQEPWWNAMKGEFTGALAQHTREQIEAMAPKMEKGTTWDYDPMPVLRKLDVPLLWILAGADLEAPPVETRRRLLALAKDGRPISVVEFPDTDHGILEFETGDDGSRTMTRYADGYFRLQIDWLKTGRLASPPYGNAQLLAISTRR